LKEIGEIGEKLEEIGVMEEIGVRVDFAEVGRKGTGSAKIPL
jgi:hypothetical protein